MVQIEECGIMVSSLVFTAERITECWITPAPNAPEIMEQNASFNFLRKVTQK